MAERKTPRASSTVREDEALKLRSISSLSDFVVFSGKTEIGTVDEFLFDDEVWAIRYVSVNAGDWLSGRKILLSPVVLEEPDWELPKLTLTLENSRLREIPSLESNAPVSRFHQIGLYRHYGWLPYWVEGEYYDKPPHPSKVISGQSPEQEKEADPHLFGTKEMVEYRVEALNGDAGHVDDFIMDEDDWVIHYLVVALEDPVPEDESGKLVLISTEWIRKAVKEEGSIYADLDKERIRNSPAYDPAILINREYELELYDHYGRPRYWDQGTDTEEEEDTRFSS